MSSLLRRSELPPLDLRRAQAEEEDAEDLFSLVVISPCQIFVSNDPPEDGLDVVGTPCNITSFNCFDTVEMEKANEPVPYKVTVEFDYEIWYSDSGTLNTTLLQMESSMLRHLATVFGLLECPLASQQTSRGSTRDLQIFTQEMADLFIGVDSTPPDVADTENSCVVPVQAASKVDSVCQPVTGYFSASVNADLESDSTAEAAIRNGLLRLLRLGMKEDLYANGDVRKVSFIGDRNLYEPPAQVETNNSSTGMSGVALTFIILAALLAFLVAGLLVRNASKKRREDHAKGIVLEDDLHFDGDEEVANAGFGGGDDQSVDGSLAATDELALQPQPTVFPVSSKSSGERNESPDAQSHSTGSSSTESDDVAAALALQVFLSTSATPSEPTYPEADASNQSTSPRKSPKKKKKRKNKKAPDSPDSLMDESLRTLDSIAEEPTSSSIIDETSDDNRSFT